MEPPVTLRLLCVTPLPAAPRSTAPKDELNPFVSKVRPPENDGAPASALLSVDQEGIVYVVTGGWHRCVTCDV